MDTSKNTTRRQFLQVATAALAPMIIPGTVLGRGLRLPPGDRLTVGLIGVGNMGSGHLGSLLGHREVELLAICDVDRGRREAACQRANDHYAAAAGSATQRSVLAYEDYEDLLARDDVDAVVIAVPDHWHAIIAIAACRAGKDVYCEKPLSLTIREAEEMVKAARRYGRVFQTGSQQRSSDNFRRACELVRSGRIGKVEKVNVGIGLPSEEKLFPEQPIPDGFNWERWLGPAPWAPYNAERSSGSYSGGWRLVRDYSGGMTTDWGAHHFDIAQWGLGMDGSGPISIEPPSEADGRLLTFRYANGVVMERGDANGVLFTGSDGKIEVNRGYFRTWPEEIGREPLAPGEVHLYRSPGHLQDWLDCIRTRRRPICDVAIGASSVTVCHLANIASWVGRSIRWDPLRRQIVGDDLASRWLDRPKRAPWRLYT